MRFKESIIYLLAVVILAGSLPITNYAASANRITKVVTVMEGDVLSGEDTPQFILYLVDGLEEGDIFYLNLEGAKWTQEIHTTYLSGPSDDARVELRIMTSGQLQVKVKEGNLHSGTSLKIPMFIQMTKEAAYVTVKNNNTAVTSGTYLVAKALSHLGKLTAGAIPVTASSGIMADLSIEEPFSQAFSKAIKKGANHTLQLQLNHNSYAFDLNKSQISLKGIKGFDGIDAGQEAIKQIDEQTLMITLPDISKARYTGGFILSGIQIQLSDKNPVWGRLTLTAEGDLLTKTTLEVLEVTDYDIDLVSQKEEVRSGIRKEVQFSLEEKVADSLIRTRPTYFSFDQGVQVETVDDKVSVQLNGKEVLCETVIENNKVVGFEIESFPEGSSSYDLSVGLIIPSHVKGIISVKAEGRSLIETLTAQVLKVISPFTVSVKVFDAKVGVKDQVGGKITLTENIVGQIAQGKNIVIELEESPIKLTKAPKIEIMQGDIRLGTPVVTANKIEIPIIRRSNTASSICLSDFVLTVDQTVADGTYTMQIGGNAFSELEDHKLLDSIWEGDFIYIGDNKPIIPDEPEETLQAVKVSFTIGKSTYTMDKEVKAMDAAPFIESGRTFLPIKYVADAMGISAGQVFGNNATKTVTIHADEKVTLKIGSTTMKVGQKSYVMSAAPMIRNGRTYVPVAEITRALKIQTEWDAVRKMVSFITYRKI